MIFPSGQRPYPPTWLTGMGTLTFGLVAGFAVTALPFLLAKIGISVDRIASVDALAMSPTFWAFLVTPVIDVGLTRRTWAFLLAAASALSLTAALWFLSPERLPVVTALLLIAELCVVLQNNAVNGWTCDFVRHADRGKVGGWINVANLGGGAIGSMALMSLASYLSFRVLGLILGIGVLTSSVFLLGFPAPARPVLAVRDVFGGTFRSVLRTVKKAEVLTGFMLFLAPVSCVAAINLFSGLGNDFHTASQQVIWVTGAGAAIACSAGALIGGFAADRLDKGRLYIAGGALAGAVSVALALTPHTASFFVVGVLVYNALAGCCYAAFVALGLELTGPNNPTAATQMGLFAASTNASVVYMTWADGQGYRLRGVRGLFLTDGLAAVAAAVPLLLFLASRRRSAQVGVVVAMQDV